jgi:23S rRNA pseudouridine2605 synthase
MHKKPFHSDNSGKKSYGSKDSKSFGKTSFGSGDKPFKKKFDKEDKPFKKSFGKDEDRPARKPYGNNEDRPFKKSFGNNEDRPARKSFGNNEDRPFKKSFDNKGDRPFKKPFEKDGDRPFKKSFGGNEDRPFKKSFDKDGDRPFKKSFDNKGGDRPFKKPFDKDGDRPFKKSFGGSEDRPFKKSFDKDGDRPFKKSFGGNEDRPFKKSFDKDGDRPFKKSFGGNEDRPFKKSFDKDGDRPFKKSFGGNEDRPFKKSFDKDGDRPFKKSFGDKGDRPFKKDGDRPFKKSFGGNEDRPFKKSYDKDGDRPFKKSFDKDGDRPFKKPYDKDGDRPFKKSFNDKGNKPFKKKHGAEDDLEEKRPNRYANAFGRLDDEELKAHQKKQQERKEQKEQEDEVTFSKELDNKWDEEPVTRDFGKSDVKYTGYKKSGADNEEEEGGENGEAEDGKKGGRARHKHDATTRFKKQFDNENPHEKAYSATSDGPKPEELKSTDNALEGQLMPLNKYIAHCDVCSRRDAVTLIKEGKVTVNGELITEPGFKVTIEDVITLNDKKLVVQKNLIYILMNKPKGFITTTDDPKGRHTVMELVESHIEERVFPVGRLDRNTTGLLLLTNDGELTQKLSHPKHEIKKVYKATLDKNLSKDDFEKILKGVVLEDGPAPVDQLEYLETKNEIGLEIHSGKNRIVRRIFESLGYEVEKLDRVMYAGLTKKNVLRGKWRFLTKQEVINLKHIH